MSKKPGSPGVPGAPITKRKVPIAAAELPGLEEALATAHAVRQLAALPRHGKAFGFLASLAASPPQVLLLEGGSARERMQAGLYWAALVNCSGLERSTDSPEAGEQTHAPCLGCSVCLRILADMHRDIFLFNGQSESIKIGQMRELRPVIADAPREARYRVVLLMEAQAMTDDAANTMLKSLEEPRPHTLYVLAAPQREHLLPTLVSRSWVLTLAWPHPHLAQEDNPGATEEQGWADCLAAFMESGKGLFERTGARGAVDALVAARALAGWQRALAAALAGDIHSALARQFAALPEARLRMAHEVLAEGQESLAVPVNPALALEWMATRLYLLRPRSARRVSRS